MTIGITCCGDIGIAVGKLPRGGLSNNICDDGAKGLFPKLLSLLCLLQLLLKLLALFTRGTGSYQKHAYRGHGPGPGHFTV